MLDEAALERASAESEATTRRIFEKDPTHKVEDLDADTSALRPDFHVFEPAGDTRGIVCEVKGVFTGGYVDGRHISEYSLDHGANPMRNAVALKSYEKTETALDNALAQYRSLVRDVPTFQGVPFVVALFFDFFGDAFDLIARNMPERPLLSAVIRVEQSKERRDFYSKFSADELLAIMEGRLVVTPPPETEKWALLRNTAAQYPVDKHWFEPCFEC
jgi:hypothetical protein